MPDYQLVSVSRPQFFIPKVYRFVPSPRNWDYWTDEKLYKKYGLTKDEIAFIESMVRPMPACADDADGEANDG